MRYSYHPLFTSLLIFFYTPIIITEKAVIIVPVADLVGTPLKKNRLHSYDNLPLCGGTHQFHHSCPRIHQLLFNEIVDVIEYGGDEVLIATSRIYYHVPNSTTKHNTYWTDKKNIMPLSEIIKAPDTINKLPPPLSYNDLHDNPQVVTLYLPFYDAITKKTYSA